MKLDGSYLPNPRPLPALPHHGIYVDRCIKELYTSSAVFINYCAFQKHANSDFQSPTDPFAFFAAVNILSGPLRKQTFTLTGSKGHGKVIP